MAITKTVWKDSTRNGLSVEIAKDTTIQLTASQPHLLCVGQVRNGMYAWQRNIVTRMCSTYSPKQLQIIMLDMRGEELKWAEKFPHITQYFEKPTQEEAQAVVDSLLQTRKERLEAFDAVDVVSYRQYREFMRDPVMPTIVLYVSEYPKLVEYVGQETLDKLLNQSGKWGMQAFFVSQTSDQFEETADVLKHFSLRISNNAKSSVASTLFGMPITTGTQATREFLLYTFPIQASKFPMIPDGVIESALNQMNNASDE